MHVKSLARMLGEVHVVGGEDEETDGVVKSAGRVLRILELFDILKREALVGEVADLLNLPQSSTSVLLHSMVVLGYLYFNPQTRAFGPTTRVALLGNWINGPIVSDGPLIRMLQLITDRTGQATVLAVRNRTWSQYIHVVQATHPVRLFVVKGARRSIVRSGTGIALLSDLPDPETKRIALRANAEVKTEGETVCISELMEEVRLTRARGWTATFDKITHGGGMIAARLPQLYNDERLVIGIAGVTTILKENLQRFVAIMQEEIADLEAQSSSHVPLVALAG